MTLPSRAKALLSLALVASPPRRRRAAATTTATHRGRERRRRASSPDKIVIGYQAIPNGDLVVKHEGWLEDALPDTEIEWKMFDSGGVLNEAIAAGSVDFGLAGSSPVARGLSTRSTTRCLDPRRDRQGRGARRARGHHRPRGSARARRSPRRSPPPRTTACWPRSRTRGSPRATSTSSTLSRRTSRPRGSGRHRRRLRLEPGAGRADRGRRHDADRLRAARAEGKTTYDLGVVTNEFADEYPDVVQTWVEQQDRAVKLFRDDPDAAAAAVAAELNLEPAAALAQMGT